MKPEIVRGHVCTWKITPTEDGQYEVTPGKKKYKDVKTAKWAIRTAEERYVNDHPDYPVANRDIWFDHGTLILDDNDGNYFESKQCEAFDADKVKKRIARTDEFDNGHVIHDDYFTSTSDEAEEKAKQMSIDNPGKTFYVKYDDVMNPSSDKKWKDGKEITESAETLNEMVDFINGLEWGKPDTKYGDEYDVVFVKDWDPEHKDCYVLQVEKVDGTIPFYCTIYHPGDMDRIKKQAIEAISSKEEVTESRNTTGRYVWCEYQYVKDKTPDQLKAFAQMAFNNRYNANAKVTHFEKERYDNAEGHCEYVMYADGLHENFDSFYFLVQCTKEEYEELPDSELYDAGDPARYYIDYFHWSHERCWVTGYDNDLDKDFELTLCDGVGDEDRGRKKALEILKDNDINVSEDARNEMISTFGLDDFGLKTESTNDDFLYVGRKVVFNYDFNRHVDEDDEEISKFSEIDGSVVTVSGDDTNGWYYVKDDKGLEYCVHNSELSPTEDEEKGTGGPDILSKKWLDKNVPDSTINEDDNDKYHQLVKELDEYLRNEKKIHVDELYFDPRRRYISGEIHNGDWKHEHLAFKIATEEFLDKKGYETSISSQEIGNSDSDCFSARYIIFIDEKSDSNEPIDLPLIKNESTKIETDPEKLATNVEATSEPQDDETLADKIENEIINGDTFVGRKCIYTYKGLIGTHDFPTCAEFDEMEKDLHELSGTEVEVVSGCPEYGYIIKSGNKEYYGIRGEELVVHDDNDYGAKEVDPQK